MLYPLRGTSVGFPACFVPPCAACVPMRSCLSVQVTVYTLSLYAVVHQLIQACMHACGYETRGGFFKREKQVERWQEVKEGRGGGDVREEEDEGMRERKSRGKRRKECEREKVSEGAPSD